MLFRKNNSEIGFGTSFIGKLETIVGRLTVLFVVSPPQPASRREPWSSGYRRRLIVQEVVGSYPSVRHFFVKLHYLVAKDRS